MGTSEKEWPEVESFARVVRMRSRIRSCMGRYVERLKTPPSGYGEERAVKRAREPPWENPPTRSQVKGLDRMQSVRVSQSIRCVIYSPTIIREGGIPALISSLMIDRMRLREARRPASSFLPAVMSFQVGWSDHSRLFTVADEQFEKRSAETSHIQCQTMLASLFLRLTTDGVMHQPRT